MPFGAITIITTIEEQDEKDEYSSVAVLNKGASFSGTRNNHWRATCSPQTVQSVTSLRASDSHKS